MFIEEPEDPSIEALLRDIDEVLNEHEKQDPRTWSVYQGYLNSRRWRELRKSAVARDDYTCRVVGCGVRKKAIHVHHIRYPNYPLVLGDETLSDLVSVCREHHIQIHNVSMGGRVDIEQATWEVLRGQDIRPTATYKKGLASDHFGTLPGLRDHGESRRPGEAKKDWSDSAPWE